MRFFKYLFGEPVSLILVIVSIITGISYFYNIDIGSPLLFFFALYIIYVINEQGRLMDNIYNLAKEQQYEYLLSDLRLPPRREGKRKLTFFEILVKFLLIAGSIFVLVMLIISIYEK